VRKLSLVLPLTLVLSGFPLNTASALPLASVGQIRLLVPLPGDSRIRVEDRGRTVVSRRTWSPNPGHVGRGDARGRP